MKKFEIESLVDNWAKFSVCTKWQFCA